MLIQSLAQKTRLAMFTVIATLAGCTLLCAFTLWRCLAMVSEERSQIYVLDGDIPFLAERAKLEANFMMEAQAHIQLFHQYFFTLPPDNDYIKWTLGKAMDNGWLTRDPFREFDTEKADELTYAQIKRLPRTAIQRQNINYEKLTLQAFFPCFN